MTTKFDYAKAIEELDQIAAKVENPETKLDDIDALVVRSKELLKQCREYLRSVKDKIDSLDKECVTTMRPAALLRQSALRPGLYAPSLTI